jgi:hypothetical protein
VHPRLQILTVAELLAGKKIDMPQGRGVRVTFEQGPRKRMAGLVTGSNRKVWFLALFR